VLLFWNPGCGFCRRMVPDLKAWESRRPADNGLVLVSSGTDEDNREMGLRSAVLLGEDFAVGKSYGASGTPSAVLIDGSGRVASALTVGASGVLALLERLEPSPAVI
jgi:thiol-disulfide isomerase/thioredoxin